MKTTKRQWAAWLVAACATVVPMQVASAQTFTVTSTANSGAGSLRDALTQANAFNGAATINFSIANSTINLSSMLPILTNPHGITINGNNNIIDGGSTSNTTGDRVFFVGVPNSTPAAAGGFLPSTAATNWSISNLTIQNGNGRGGNGGSGGGGAGLGGAIFLNAGNLSLSVVNFSNNRAVGGSASGGNFVLGGGGMGGNGGEGGGGGGFGLGANGGGFILNAGAAGQFTNGAPGANGSGGIGGFYGGGGGGGGTAGGGGGGVGAVGASGGFGGGGGEWQRWLWWRWR